MKLFIKEIIAVAVGGALGSVFRFGLSRWIQGSYLGKLYSWVPICIVNILGCFIMGVLYAILVHRIGVGPVMRAAILIGLLGGFTTFSSFSMDTIALLQSGDMIAAASNVILSVSLSLLATGGALWLTQALINR